MFIENDVDGVAIENDEQADASLEIPTVEFKEGEENVQLPAATVKKLIAASKTAIAQKKHWRGKAIDPVSGKPYKELAAAGGGNTHKEEESSAAFAGLQSEVGELKQIEEKRQFGHAHGLAPEIVDHVFAFAAGQKKKPVDVLTSPFVQSAITGMKATARADGARPGPSNRGAKVEGKTFNEMNDAERRANFGGFVKNLTGK